jgi:hypothetical protein
MNLGCTLQSAVALAKDEQWETLRRRLAPLFCPGKLQKSGVSFLEDRIGIRKSRNHNIIFVVTFIMLVTEVQYLKS